MNLELHRLSKTLCLCRVMVHSVPIYYELFRSTDSKPPTGLGHTPQTSWTYFGPGRKKREKEKEKGRKWKGRKGKEKKRKGGC